MPAPSKILIKGSSIPGRIPELSSLEFRELAVNTADGTIFFKNSQEEILTFQDASKFPNTLNQTLTSSNLTYVTNLSVLGKIYGDGSELLGVTGGSGDGDESVNTLVRSSSADWDMVGDRYFTTSSSTNTINKGTKVFAVSADLSYIPTQDITIVHDHDIESHMHGTVLDYNSSTGSLTADITSRTGSGTYSNWKINLGGTPAFVNSLVVSNNLSDVADSTIALANLQGVSRSEIQNLSGVWQQTSTTVSSNSASWNYQGTDLKELSADWQSVFTVVQTNSAAWNSPPPKRHDFVDVNDYSISYAAVAPYGSAENSNVWNITKIIYTNVGTVSSTQYANNVAWTNRLNAVYT